MWLHFCRTKTRGLFVPKESSSVHVAVWWIRSQTVPALKLPAHTELTWLFGDLARPGTFFPSSERSSEGEGEAVCSPSPVQSLPFGGFTPGNGNQDQDMLHCSIPGTSPSLTQEVLIMQRKGRVFIEGVFPHPQTLPSLRISVVTEWDTFQIAEVN